MTESRLDRNKKPARVKHMWNLNIGLIVGIGFLVLLFLYLIGAGSVANKNSTSQSSPAPKVSSVTTSAKATPKSLTMTAQQKLAFAKWVGSQAAKMGEAGSEMKFTNTSAENMYLPTSNGPILLNDSGNDAGIDSNIKVVAWYSFYQWSDDNNHTTTGDETANTKVVGYQPAQTIGVNFADGSYNGHVYSQGANDAYVIASDGNIYEMKNAGGKDGGFVVPVTATTISNGAGWQAQVTGDQAAKEKLNAVVGYNTAKIADGFDYAASGLASVKWDNLTQHQQMAILIQTAKYFQDTDTNGKELTELRWSLQRQSNGDWMVEDELGGVAERGLFTATFSGANVSVTTGNGDPEHSIKISAAIEMFYSDSSTKTYTNELAGKIISQDEMTQIQKSRIDSEMNN